MVGEVLVSVLFWGGGGGMPHWLCKGKCGVCVCFCHMFLFHGDEKFLRFPVFGFLHLPLIRYFNRRVWQIVLL